MWTIQKIRSTWFLDNNKKKKNFLIIIKQTLIGNKGISNSLKVIGIVIRKCVKGKGVIV